MNVIFVLALLAFIAYSEASACCVYANMTGDCDEIMCPNTCVWTYTECPYYADCTLMQRYSSPACTETGGCLCLPGNWWAAGTGPMKTPTKKIAKTESIGKIGKIRYDELGPIIERE